MMNIVIIWLLSALVMYSSANGLYTADFVFLNETFISLASF